MNSDSSDGASRRSADQEYHIPDYPADNRPSPSDSSPPSSPVGVSQTVIPEKDSPESLGLSNPKISEARRRQLDAINRLQSLGVQLDIDIPQIVVIGSQSVGKSSLIESISGVSLPRSSGTCTRCPTECRLIHCSTEPWRCLVSIRFMTDESGVPLDKVRNVPFGPPIRNPKEVEERLRRAQHAALNPSAKDPASFLKGNYLDYMNLMEFTTNCVSLEIRGPDIMDLSFCDLPGLIASTANDDNQEDVEKVEQLVSSYISKPSCIILLTVTCETDFEIQGAYRLVNKHDKDGTRTIGVLTKPDRIPDGEEDRWIKLIKNNSSRLKNGWYCVKQPDTKELQKGLTFTEARRRGEDFFRTTKHFWQLEAEHQTRLGTQALTQKLNEYLMTMISERLPQLMQELQNKLQETKEELQKIPERVSKDPVLELMHLIGEFSDELFRHAEGVNYDISIVLEAKLQGNQFEHIAKAHETFRQRVRATAPDFHPFDENKKDPGLDTPPRAASPESYCSIRSRRTVHCEALPRDARVLPEPDFLKSEEVDHLPCFQDPICLEDIVQRVQKATTRELPGYYPFSVLQDLISYSTRQWEEPACSLVDSIYWSVLNHRNALVKTYFGEYTAGGLKQKVLKTNQEYMQKRRAEAVKRVKWLLELEAHAFTLNRHYFDSYRAKFLNFYKDQRERHLYPYGQLPSSPSEPWDANKYGLEIMATVRAYFQVAFKRVVDNVPLAIDHELVRVQKRDLQEAISLGLDITGPEARERCERLLAEPPERVAHRKELRNRLDRLSAAQDELVDF